MACQIRVHVKQHARKRGQCHDVHVCNGVWGITTIVTSGNSCAMLNSVCCNFTWDDPDLEARNCQKMHQTNETIVSKSMHRSLTLKDDHRKPNIHACVCFGHSSAIFVYMHFTLLQSINWHKRDADSAWHVTTYMSHIQTPKVQCWVWNQIMLSTQLHARMTMEDKTLTTERGICFAKHMSNTLRTG